VTHLTSKFIFWGLFQASLMLRKPLDLEESVTSINPLFTMATVDSQRDRAQPPLHFPARFPVTV